MGFQLINAYSLPWNPLEDPHTHARASLGVCAETALFDQYPLAANFGGLLQPAAVQEAVRVGWKSFVVMYRGPAYSSPPPCTCISKVPNHGGGGKSLSSLLLPS